MLTNKILFFSVIYSTVGIYREVICCFEDVFKDRANTTTKLNTTYVFVFLQGYTYKIQNMYACVNKGTI